MKVSKKLYIDEGVPHGKWKVWKLRRNKKVENLYCIVYVEKGFLEIINSKHIKDRYKKSTLIGVAMTRQSAMALLARIFQEVYLPSPNIQEMRAYFIVDNS